MYFPTSSCARNFAAIGVPEPRPHRKPVPGPVAPIAQQERSMTSSQHSGMDESLCFYPCRVPHPYEVVVAGCKCGCKRAFPQTCERVRETRESSVLAGFSHTPFSMQGSPAQKVLNQPPYAPHAAVAESVAVPVDRVNLRVCPVILNLP
jgi:hypothetical protein